MSAEIHWVPEAERDLTQAYNWYEGRKFGLGEEYLLCVEALLETIRRTPGMCRTVRGNYRRGLLRRFPYSIIYEYSYDVVTVYAVCHASRDPETWRSRLP